MDEASSYELLRLELFLDIQYCLMDLEEPIGG